MGEWAKFYENPQTITEEINNLHGHTTLFERIADYRCQRLLEVGVGSGSMSRYLAQRGFNVVGVDIEPDIVARASALAERVSGVEYTVADAFSLESRFQPGAFGVAFSQGFFEHFEDEGIRHLLGQQLSVANHVVFSVPSDQYPWLDFGNERLLSPDRWTSLLEGMGLVEASYYGVYERHGWLGRLKGYPREKAYHVLVRVEQTPPSVG